jgi:transposase
MANKLQKGRERLRGKMMEMVKRGQKTLKAVSLELGISYRQAKRVYQKYLGGGDEALIHGNKGKPSNRRIDQAIVQQALSLYEEKYSDFGPTLAYEKLLERDGLEIGVSKLRRGLIAARLWMPEQNSREYRARRTAREHFRELIQFDGSHHDWFEGRRSRCCLITLIDDATKTRLSQFFEEETMFGAMSVLKMWIETHGIPESLYCDKKNAFVLTREPTDSELLAGITQPKSHFGKACHRLGITVIPAHSPQAKGRVERNHGVDQDRLVKELRLAGISTIDQANIFLLETYLPYMNSKFSRPPKNADDAHVKPGTAVLDDILCMEYDRKVSKDYIVRFECRLFQILPEAKIKPRPGDAVLVRVRLDSSVRILWKNKALLVKEIKTMFDD